MQDAPRNRTFGWALRTILSSLALEVTYRLAPPSAEGFRAALLDAEAAMRRDSNLPARRDA